MVDVGSAKLRQNTRDARGFFGLFGTFRCWDTRRVLAEMACEGNPSAALDSVLYLAAHFKLSPTAAALRMRPAVAASGVCRSLDGSSGWLEMVRSRSKVRPDLSCLLVLWGKSLPYKGAGSKSEKEMAVVGRLPMIWGMFPEDYNNHKY
ncbi:hypothetical protein BO85DRAFT_472436 [Aspergillus piperis CBS 112811]|uniref:Uncharacterized protein n=1 Tax=Aspergillus piperis CBS 112811 TaxID=1448313 RepID=A0A8G1QU24_9EURO|nr:hypothetical protein BO85DRAFT_472436 [Aspergillus piperis CBS 112811]RAH52842.1 hypothetical protein BO85DRAFT_472436 [Aspergillus piperis CBS 112811]